MVPYEVTFYTGDIENAGCDCDISLKLFGTTGSSSEHVIKKDEGQFERGTIDRFRFELDDVGEPIKLRVAIKPHGKRGRHQWYLQNIELVKDKKQRPYFFGFNDWLSKDNGFSHDIPIAKRGKALVPETTYRVTTKTSDIADATCHSKVFMVIRGKT